MTEVTVGQVKGNFKVIAEPFKVEKVWYVKVRCTCGKEVDLVKGRFLHKTKFTQCKSCASKENNRKKKNQGHKSIGTLGGTFYNHIKKGAKFRKIPFHVSKEFLWELFNKQDCKCALSGLPISLTRELSRTRPDFNKITASLDRINSSKGYTEDNVQWVHKWINTMKNTLSNDDFIFLCSHVCKFNHGNHEPSLEYREINYSRKVQRLTGEDSLSNNPDTSAQHPKEDDDIV